MTKMKKNKGNFFALVKKIKPSRLIFLIVLVVANTFAWFIYATKIDGSISVHVKSWNISFEAGDSQVTENVNINVGDIYPGMEDYEYSISAYNQGEVSANLSYKILEARILNTTYVTTEGRAENGETPLATDLTSLELEDMLYNDFPFQISLNLSGTTIAMGNGVEDFTLEVTWPYESGDDATDTAWGMDAYDYKESNPSSPSIAIRVKIIITQNPS